MKSIISKLYPIFVLGVIFLFTLFINVWIGTFLFLLSLTTISKVNYLWFLFPLFIIALIEFTQYTTYDMGDYDILRYYAYYNAFAHSTQSEAIILLGLTGQYTFYIIIFVLSKIFPEDPRWFSFFFPLITGSVLYFSYKNFFTFFKLKYLLNRTYGPLEIVMWILGFVCIISVVNLGNIVRQYLAFSLFIFSYSRFLLGKRYWLGLVLCFFAHWSMSIFVTLFLLFRNKPEKMRMFLLPALFLGVANVAQLLGLIDYRIMGWIETEALGVDKTLMLILFFSTLMLYYYLIKIDVTNKTVFILMCIMLFEYIFIWRSSLATRFFYNYNEYFEVLLPILPFIKNQHINPRIVNLFWMAPALFVSLYNYIQINRSNFEYLIFSRYGFWNSAIDILTTPLPSGLL